MADDDLHNLENDDRDIIFAPPMGVEDADLYADTLEALETALSQDKPDLDVIENILAELEEQLPEQELNAYSPPAVMPAHLLQKMANLGDAGLGIIGVSGRESTGAQQQEHKERRRRSNDFTLRTQLAIIDQKIAENDLEISKLIDRNADITARIQALEAESAAAEQDHNEIADRIIALKQDLRGNSAHFATLRDQLPEETQAALDEYIEAGLDIITVPYGEDGQRYIVSQNEDGNYTITVDGEEITITDPAEITRIEYQRRNGEMFESELTQEQIDNFLREQGEFYDLIQNGQLEVMREGLGALFAEKELLDAQMDDLQNDYREINERREAIESELEELRAEYIRNEARIAELEQENAALDAERSNLITRLDAMQERQNTLDDNYESLLADLQGERAQTAEVERLSAETLAVINDYDSRHAFIIDRYGLQNVQDFWNNAITDDEGRVVYDDENLGAYYLDEDSERVYYADLEDQEVQIAQIEYQAWVEGRSYGNERPDSQDFAQRLGQRLTQERESADIDRNVTAQRTDEEEARLALQQSVADEIDPDGGINAPNMSGAFAIAAAAPQEAPDKTQDNVFAPSMSRPA